MIYKESKDKLLKENLIKKCPIDYKAISSLTKRAHIDLKTAKRNLDKDEECAFNYAYNAMLRSGLALMFSEGFRPDIKDKHLTVIRFVSIILGDEFKKLINDYDFMRKKRNRFIYEPDIPCSMKEAKDALKTAGEFVDKISKLIREKFPQKEFNFKN
ncbi:MAG: HEPN domain-containing protein [Candidatus Omnitrophica bacterium]|nr:HEPN domain-containing protein [Candidatus Omnitrophota bacterium]MBU1924989.1 HEPN domain-containing protein [Candidatus Omnitrophota bacterium]